MLFNCPFKIEFKNLFDICLQCVGIKLADFEDPNYPVDVKLENIVIVDEPETSFVLV